MSPLLLSLLVVLILPLFLATWRTSLTGLALQGLLMGWLAFRLHPRWSAEMALTELDLLGLRAVAVPVFLGRVLVRGRAAGRNDVIPPNMLAWAAALALVLLAFRFADAASPGPGDAHLVVAVSMTGVLLGLLILATQSGAFSQVVGVLRIENAIALFEIGTNAAAPIAGDGELLQFGPLWSPDGQWLLYQRCLYRQDPGHERSDVCISRADGSEHRLLTDGQSHWFATSYGTPGRHGSGSNMPVWSPDGRVSCALLLPGSRTAWPYAEGRPDRDHFNRDYRPELARGGTRICLIDPQTGAIVPITHDDPPTWNFRLCWSPDGSRLAFVRADVGCPSELWVMDADGGNRRRLTRGLNGAGVDHPRWARLAVPSL